MLDSDLCVYLHSLSLVLFFLYICLEGRQCLTKIFTAHYILILSENLN